MASADLTADIAREYLSYDQSTGELRWRFDHWGRKTGELAGGLHKSTGYMRVSLLGKKISAHRLIWLMVHDEWPPMLDHINGIRTDNRLENLRVTDSLLNSQNRIAPSVGSSASLLGAQMHKASGLWKSTIRSGEKKISLGLFATQEEAHAAYVQAKRILHKGNTL